MPARRGGSHAGVGTGPSPPRRQGRRRALPADVTALRCSAAVASGEHGDGHGRAELWPKMFGPELMRAFAEFKAVWDPGNKMNPHKLVDPYPLDAHLRGAELLPLLSRNENRDFLRQAQEGMQDWWALVTKMAKALREGTPNRNRIAMQMVKDLLDESTFEASPGHVIPGRLGEAVSGVAGRLRDMTSDEHPE